MRFRVDIVKGETAHITDFWPDGDLYFRYADDSKIIAKDGRSATLFYSLLGAVWPRIRITTSEPCNLQLIVENGEKPFVVEIK